MLKIKNKTHFLTQIAPYLYLALAQLMVAFNVIGSKLIIHHASFLSAVFLRFLFASLIIFSLYLLKGDCKRTHFYLEKKQWLFLMIQGLCAGVFFNLLLMLGLQYTSASMAGLLISLLPAVIALSALIFLK